MAKSPRYIIREFMLASGECPYRSWLQELDKAVAARIQARVFRFEQGNLGDAKSVGDGVYEARFDFGPGYRLYFGLESGKIILLLCGGDKGSQKKDIRKAKEYWKEYLG